MTQENLNKIAKRYAQDELKDNHSAVEDVVAAAFLNGIDFAEHHPHWISVEDELPPNDDTFFDLSIDVLATNGNDIYKGFYDSSIKGWLTVDFWHLDSITHWMALPKPPAKLSSVERTGKNEL